MCTSMLVCYNCGKHSVARKLPIYNVRARAGAPNCLSDRCRATQLTADRPYCCTVWSHSWAQSHAQIKDAIQAITDPGTVKIKHKNKRRHSIRCPPNACSFHQRGMHCGYWLWSPKVQCRMASCCYKLAGSIATGFWIDTATLCVHLWECQTLEKQSHKLTHSLP